MLPHRRKTSRRLGLQGSVWISVGDQQLGGSGRFDLLPREGGGLIARVTLPARTA